MNDTTFQGNGSVKYVPVVVDAKPKTITNADRIRRMTDEELSVILAMQSEISPPWCMANDVCPYIDQDPARCDLCALEWLKREAET